MLQALGMGGRRGRPSWSASGLRFEAAFHTCGLPQSRHITPLAAPGRLRAPQGPLGARNHRSDAQDEEACCEAGSEEATLSFRDQGRGADEFPGRDAPGSSGRVQTSPPGLVGPLGRDENRVSVIALDDFKDLVELMEVGQDERHRPAPVLRLGAHAFHENRVEQRVGAWTRGVRRGGVAIHIPRAEVLQHVG